MKHVGEAPVVGDVVLERSALGAERPLVDRVVGIALDVDELSLGVLAFAARGR
jgi:hypothetical protein